MTDSSIQPGAFVWRDRFGVGKVTAVNGNPSILFWANRESGRTEKIPAELLTLLQDDSPEVLLWESPEELASWATGKPLPLVALALFFDGGTGKVADIKEKLDSRVILDGQWNKWWKKRTKPLANLPKCFEVVKTSKGNEFRLLSSVDAVPTDWTEPKSAGLADWKKWLLSGTHEAPPGRFPTKPVADALGKWQAKSIEQALFRVVLSAEEISASSSASAQVAEGWLRAVAQASLRWREAGGTDSRGYMAARVGELLARLSRIAGDRTPQDLLLRAGALDGEADAWRRGFAASMWEAFDGDDTRDLYRRSSAVLGRQARADLAREVALASFGPEFSGRRHAGLDRLLDALSEGDRLQLMREMIAYAGAGPRDRVLDYIANSRHAAKSEDPAERLNLLMLAAIALSGGQGEVVVQASGELADAFAGFGEYDAAIQALLSDILVRTAQERASIIDEMESQRQSYNAELERERREQEQLQDRVETLRNQLFSGYEQSKLDIRQDMLVIVGELSQLADNQDCASENFLRDMRAGLALALQAGGANALGSVGDTTSFDPLKHQAADSIRTGDTVRITAPGIIVKGQRTSDRVLAKAQVSGISEKG